MCKKGKSEHFVVTSAKKVAIFWASLKVGRVETWA